MGKSNKTPPSGDNLLPPAKLRPEEKSLCKKLDDFYRFYKLDKRPSDYYRGAIFAAREETKSNSDWLAQATHSLREILYPFFSAKDKKIKTRKIKAFEKFGAVGAKLVKEQEIGTFWGKLNKIAHHQLEITFDDLRQEFVKILNKVLAYQLDIHKLIDETLKKGPKPKKSKEFITEIGNLISLNPDAHQYFFAKADERWLDWLWKNGFLDVIKEKAQDPTKYGYRTPELNYLVKVSEKEPTKVADIMLGVPISAETFNPEVIDRFLWICSALPAEQLAQIVPKIRNKKWIPLMGLFNRSGLEYEKMFQSLAGIKDYNSILVLAEAILAVRTKEEMEKTANRITTDKPFYFNDLSYTKVFEYLISVADEYAKKALDLATKVMAKVVFLGGKSEGDSIFPMQEIFYLFDVDFFAIELGQKERFSGRDDVRELVAMIKMLIQRLIGDKCKEVDTVHSIYEKYIKPLPDSRTMWRLRLFALSLCPEVFKDELKKVFSRLFEVMKAEKPYYEIESGTEYKKALQRSFKVLGKKYQREYVRNVFTYFGKSRKDKKEEKWYKRDGWQILSSICEYLTEEEGKKCEEVFGKKCDAKFEPEPSIGKMRGGTVVPRGPITQEEFGKLSIADIIKKLKTDWTPEKLSKQNKSEDFLNPLNAEGVGKLLQADIYRRLQDYINNANLFFERGALDQHYTYSFLRGIQEFLRENKTNTTGINLDNLITLCTTIKDSGEAKPFDRGKRERDSFDVWLAGWDAVHSTMTDLIQELLNEKGGGISIDFSKYREQLFAIISYLLSYPDPMPEDEKLETAKSKTKSPDDPDYSVSDPFTMAINTVRGRAFQSLVLFIYQDGKKFSEKESSKISSDVKKLYETILKKENTRALMFMFGHYLPSFYFRDKKWMSGLLLQIFPKEPEKKDLYTAAWEGYLSTSLYEEIFFNYDIQELYKRGLTLTDADYPKQKHFQEPDKGIAVHLALAFIHFSEFGFEHDLFKEFWDIENPERHKEFISFIGRHSISREAAAEWIKYNKVDIEKLRKFWDWALEHCAVDALGGFGYWINSKDSIFEINWLAHHMGQTLEKTKGDIEWDYNLRRSLIIFAKESPEDTLEILRAYLFEGVAKSGPQRGWFHLDNEIIDAFKVLYEHPKTKKGVQTLINNLLPYHNGLFWGLKSVLDEKKSQ